mmetsp:Transcript_22728/g.37998  ORF Transcript_22728/g.37998 Transcript_22728/m.37998 type:complete len:301 (-) Transcript_22728:177-1079(-)|eukprot:CAMPEP_0198216658 /NCGR_PEP_ID=MMETSP1445-20131203/58917_1 /TAXON_ID=36898 /ORGANISM="Pyramimonas sp., Strain CCMP2087" /LENGTH=300 /DNA_ID=CAMNT_0043892989 /DNA_START=451 /DNA_END=1353 /DNA_ORIENTATION=+
MSVGATRNISATFLKYRDQARSASKLNSAFRVNHLEGEESRLVEIRSSTFGGASLPPSWVDDSEEVAADMKKIKAKMADLTKLHGRSLLVTFDDCNDDETSIEIMTQEVTRLFKRVEQRLRKLTEGSSPSSDEEKVRKNILIAWATELQKLSVDFRKQQKGYLQKVQAQQAPGTSGIMLDFDSKNEDEFDMGFSASQLIQVTTSDSLAKERDQEVMNIVQAVNDLAQVMKDLSVLVIDQGSIVDRIDYNCEQVKTTVAEGLKQVVKAEKTQKKGRMVLCIMFLLAAVLFMLIVVIIRIVI